MTFPPKTTFAKDLIPVQKHQRGQTKDVRSFNLQTAKTASYEM